MKNILFLLTLIACSKAVPSPVGAPPNPSEVAPTDNSGFIVPDVEELKKLAVGEDKAILEKLAAPGNNCNFINNFKYCEKTTLDSPSFKNAPRKNKFARVMILESLYVPKASLLQYRNSTLGYFYFDRKNPGELKEANFKIEVPKLLEQIVEEHFLSDPKIQKELTISGKYLARFSAKITHPATGVETSNHMETVYDLLKAMSPEVEVLLADYPVIPNDMLCRMDEAGAMIEIGQFYRRAARNLIRLSKEAQIDFVNHSWAPTLESIRRHLQFCERKDYIEDEVIAEYLKTQTEEFLEPLAYQSGAIIVAGVPNTIDHCLNRICDADSYVARKIPNVIRVGYANIKNSGIGPDGMVANIWRLPHDQPKTYPGVDVIINSGIDEDAAESYLTPIFGPMHIPSPEDIANVPEYQKWWTDDSLHFVRKGFVRMPIHGMATSWATPVALAMIVHLDSNSKGEYLKSKKAEEFWKVFSKKVFDPSANKTLNKFLF